jgi:hypothetical protein
MFYRADNMGKSVHERLSSRSVDCITANSSASSCPSHSVGVVEDHNGVPEQTPGLALFHTDLTPRADHAP